MTMHAQDIVGARVTSTDGQVVGTVEQVFNDDVDGTPVWARIKAGRRNRFVPLGGSRLGDGGLSVPFETRRIIGGPEISADQHMSATQAEQLSRYYGLTVPPQGGDRDQQVPPKEGQQQAQQQQAQQEAQQQAQPGRTGTQASERPGRTGTQASQRPDSRAAAQPGGAEPGAEAGAEWLVRAEERISLGTQTMETGRVRIRKYVDTEPVEQAVKITREEYDVERVPITEGERVSGDLTEGEREIILHEERAVLRKETVPVERVRLVTRKVEEDQTIRDEIRKERIEVEPAAAAGQQPGTRR
jgi:uncharacterized protein (TIGR02271 family)